MRAPSIRSMRAFVLTALVVVALVVIYAGFAQSAPNSAAVVNGVAPHCTEDHLWVFYDRSGPVPTSECRYPPDP